MHGDRRELQRKTHKKEAEQLKKEKNYQEDTKMLEDLISQELSADFAQD